jgi:hypothetical protein
VSDVDEFCPTSDQRVVEVHHGAPGRFRMGDRVTVRSTPSEPTDNPRTPSYAIGHTGTVVAAHGVILNPIDHRSVYAPMYSIRFAGSDLFGPRATHTVVSEIHEEWLDGG